MLVCIIFGLITSALALWATVFLPFHMVSCCNLKYLFFDQYKKYYSLQFFPYGMLHCFIAFYLLSHCYYHYYLAMTIGPGHPPKPKKQKPNPTQQAETPSISKAEEKSPTSTNKENNTGADNEVKMCTVCKIPKPPRSHHCKICRTCALRMDHHCMHWYSIGEYLYSTRPVLSELRGTKQPTPLCNLLDIPSVGGPVCFISFNCSIHALRLEPEVSRHGRQH